jgi:hypothetical protein
MGSQEASAAKPFSFFMQQHQHSPPQYPTGKWRVESDGLDEYEILDEKGNVIASFDEKNFESRDHMLTMIQCTLLIPQLVPAVYTAMHALRDNVEDDQTAGTVAIRLSNLLRDCYSSPKE